MDTREQKYALMQSKLEEGLARLEGLTEDDQDVMGIVLIKLHGALEDFIRLEVGEKAPQLRATVEDARLTAWKDLLDHASTYLGFTETDRRTISEANVQRQNVAHGGNYQGKLSDLKRYARFVQKWCKRASVPSGDDWGQGQVIDLHRSYEPVERPAYVPPPVSEPLPDYESLPARPWYRSTLFLFVIFFLFPPLWAYLMITDRQQGCLVRLAAYGVLLAGVLVCLGLAWFISDTTDLRRLWDGLNIPGLSTEAPPERTRPTAAASPPAVPADETAPPATEAVAGCTVVWEEYPGDLGAKTRAMVWEQIVAERMRGSDMTLRQFYDQVVEQNPDLAKDGFEFKRGKTYLLPKCEE